MSTDVHQTTDLRWIVSQSASCFHAADALRRGRELVDPALMADLAEPVARLRAEIEACGLEAEPFWRHLVPLAAGIENNRQLAETALRKVVGISRAGRLAAPLAGRITDVEAAARRNMADLVESIGPSARRLQQQWQDLGPGLLYGAGRLSDERLIVPRADAFLVYAAQSGGGVAHLPYNSVRIEAVAPEADGPLPEIVRLVWLVAQLNVDLPLFSETIHRERQTLIAALAMLPPVLTAAHHAELCQWDRSTVEAAVSEWLVDHAPSAGLTGVVLAWWDTYVASRPPWNVALTALDRMIDPPVARVNS